MGVLVLFLIGALTGWLFAIVRASENDPGLWFKIAAASVASVVAGFIAAFFRRGDAVLDGRLGVPALLIGFAAALIASAIVARHRARIIAIAARH